MEKIKGNKPLLASLLFCLTLGLMPYNEPHIIGKVKWIVGGAKGMEAMDVFDLLLHGSPWLLLIFFALKALLKK